MSPVQEGLKEDIHQFETFSAEWAVYVPLVGVLLHAPDPQIGNVRLMNMAGETAERQRTIPAALLLGILLKECRS